MKNASQQKLTLNTELSLILPSTSLDLLENLKAEQLCCPKCESENYDKLDNKNKGSSKYSCKKCSHIFTFHPPFDEEGREIKCPSCNSRKYWLKGIISNKQHYKCIDCKKSYALNSFGIDDLGLTGIACRWCQSTNFSRSGVLKNGKQQCICRNCDKAFTIGGERPDILTAPKEFDFNHDVWTAEHLGYEKGIHYHEKINFGYINQPWLKYYFKKFILYGSSTKLAFTTLNGKVGCINVFASFLKNIGYSQEFEGINRSLMLDYFVYLRTNKYSYSRHTHCISTVKGFFETATFNGWFNVEPALIRPEDWLKKPKTNPRYIPEEVMTQLINNLHLIHEPVMRMILVTIEGGFRIGELTRLPFDCLKSNGKGGWYIQYKMYKMNKEHTKPISQELSNVIKEQQDYIKKNLGDDFPYLFCGRARGHSKGEYKGKFVPVNNTMSGQSFGANLNSFAKKVQVKDALGKLWNFQSHQFRHTVGTRMINAGVPQHIIQKYLGHTSPEMTMVYAHIHDETLRKEIEKYHESTPVNFQGEVVELEETILSSSNDLEWFTKNVQPRALEHGYCGRPRVLGDCNIPGFDGCYDCPHWRTNKNFLPILQDTLARTCKVIEKARNCGWELQVKKNEPIKYNLEKVIKSLEADSNE